MVFCRSTCVAKQFENVNKQWIIMETRVIFFDVSGKRGAITDNNG